MLSNVIERAKELKADLEQTKDEMVTQTQFKEVRTPIDQKLSDLKQSLNEQGKDIRRILLILSRSEPPRTP